MRHSGGVSDGKIYLAATPIGDVDDASPRLRHWLGAADLIAAEDTRRLLNLAGRLEVPLRAPVVAFHDHNEAEKAPDLLNAAREGKNVLVVSDAGMPVISDPGYRLVAAAAREAIAVTVLPGPSAVLTALALSGLASDRFAFEGFIPRKDGERSRRFADLSDDERTLIFFDSPHRIASSLADMAFHFGDERQAAVCRELTKTYEEVRRGTLTELAEWAAGGVRGEITLVVAGAEHADGEPEEYVTEVLTLVNAGMRLKAAAGYVSERVGVRKNELYEAALARRGGE